MIARTSLEAYDPQGMSSVRESVYRLIKDCPMLSNRDIAAILGKDTGTISGRTNELSKDGLIRAWSTKKDPVTGKRVQVWEVVA